MATQDEGVPEDAAGVSGAGGQDAPYPSERAAWYVVGVLMVVYVISFMDRQILALMVGPIREDLSITEKQMGLLMGPGFAIFYALFGFPLGRLADTKSRRSIIAIGLVAWSVMTGACGIAQRYWQLLIFRVGVGVGEASLSPSAYSLITDYFRPSRLALAISVYGTGIYIGSGLAFILGATIIGAVAGAEALSLPLIGEVHSWQLVFLVLAVPGLLFAAIVFSIREPIRRGLGKAKNAGATVAVPMGEVLTYIGANWKTFTCHTVGFSFLSFIGYGSASWVPTFYVRVHGWDIVDTGLRYGAAVIVFGTAGILFGGHLAGLLAKRGYKDSKMRVGWFAAMLHLPFGAAFVLVPNGWMAYAIMCPASFLLAMPFGVAPAAIQEMMPNTMRGQASALYLFIVNLIGLALGPLAVATVTQDVFKDDNMVGMSLLWTGLFAGTMSIVLLGLGLKHFRASLEHRDEWHAANA